MVRPSPVPPARVPASYNTSAAGTTARRARRPPETAEAGVVAAALTAAKVPLARRRRETAEDGVVATALTAAKVPLTRRRGARRRGRVALNEIRWTRSRDVEK